MDVKYTESDILRHESHSIFYDHFKTSGWPIQQFDVLDVRYVFSAVKNFR